MLVVGIVVDLGQEQGAVHVDVTKHSLLRTVEHGRGGSSYGGGHPKVRGAEDLLGHKALGDL